MNPDQEWNIPPLNLGLVDHEVHVWQISLQQPESTVQRLLPLLASEEAARAKRFVYAKDRHHFIVAHAFLRILLSRYLKTTPDQLHFLSNAYGKPQLDLPSHEHTLHFNLSHSYHLALYAFTYVGQIGIDVEYMRPDIEYEQLAMHYFSPAESVMLRGLPPEAKQQAFYNCWTRKEAYIKARGEGLSLPLDQFDVSFKPGEPAALLSSREGPQEIARWELQVLTPAPGYAGALAVEGHGWHLRCWQSLDEL